MTKKLLVFFAFLSATLFLNAQCGPSYSDNANFDSAGSSVGISFTTDNACAGTLTSITFSSGFTVQPSGPTNTIGYATVRLYEGNGLGGTVLGTLTNEELTANGIFDFSSLMISMSASTQYTIIVSDFTLPTSTGHGFNTPWVPNYTGGALYMNDTERPGEHLAFSVSIDDSTLSVNDVDSRETTVRVYPNPAVNSIQLTALKQLENYTILDVYGKKVLEGTVSGNEVINIEQLNKGIYFIQLKKKVLKILKK